MAASPLLRTALRHTTTEGALHCTTYNCVYIFVIVVVIITRKCYSIGRANTNSTYVGGSTLLCQFIELITFAHLYLHCHIGGNLDTRRNI